MWQQLLVTENQLSRNKMCVAAAAGRGVARLFKMMGWQEGSGVSGGGADWDSKWRFSIDLCTKCNFIGGERGAEFLPGGSCPPGYATGCWWIRSIKPRNLIREHVCLFTWHSLALVDLDCKQDYCYRLKLKYLFYKTGDQLWTPVDLKST